MGILIVGANSAVAQAMALRFAEKDADIFCFIRNQQSFETWRSCLGDSLKGSYTFDFCENSEIESAMQAAIESLGSIDVAFIAHGFLSDQDETERSYLAFEQTMQVNCLSVIALITAIKPVMLNQGRGKIAVISSVAGDRGRPRNFSYGAAKGAVSLYLQGLRSVLWDSGIEIYDFKMGPVDTPMTVDHDKNFSFSSIERVTERMFALLQTRQYTAYVPGYWRWVMLAVRNMPECLFQRLSFLSGR